MSRPSKFGKSRQSFDSETSNFTTPPLSPRSSHQVGSQLVSYYAGGAYGDNIPHGNPAYYIESPSRNSFSFNDLGDLQSFAANSTPSGSQVASPLHHSFASIPHQQPHQYLNQQQQQQHPHQYLNQQQQHPHQYLNQQQQQQHQYLNQQQQQQQHQYLNQQQHQQQAVYGNPRPGSRRVLPQPHNVSNVAAGGVPTVHKKGYQPWNGGTIQEEEEQRPLGSSGGRGVSRWCAFFMSAFVAALCIVIVGLIYWLVCHPSAPRVQVKNINFQAFSIDEGSDPTGVATQVLTADVITTLSFGNPSKYFGFHVSAPYLTLSYQQIVVAQGETKKFFQKKKSTGAIVVDVTSTRAPVYGAGPDLLSAVSSSGGLPLQLQIRVQSEARVIWEIVQPRYRSNIDCDLVLNPTTLKLLSQNCHRG